MLGTLLPSLLTPVPGPRSVSLAEDLALVECPALTMRRAKRAERTGAPHDPISWHEAQGSNVRDVDGNIYVDLTAGFGAAFVGHAEPNVVNAVRAQIGRLVHALGDVHPSDTKVHLLAALGALAPWPARVILGLSGADAVEAAMKTAVLATGKHGVVAFNGGYHGLSHGPLAACGYGEGFRTPFVKQLNPHVRFAEYPTSAEELSSALKSVARAFEALDVGVGAILVEPIQGRGGVRVPPPEFLPALASLARKNGSLLIVDEIYTGLGRTGTNFLHLEHGCEADLICLGKALGGGFPVSACLGRVEVMAAWGDPGGEALHTSTFLGNPVGCAAARACLAQLAESDAPRLALERSARLQEALLSRDLCVRGRGLLLGVEVDGPERVFRAVRRLLERGYITSPAGAPASVVCLTPPLCLTNEQIGGFADSLAGIVKELQ